MPFDVFYKAMCRMGASTKTSGKNADEFEEERFLKDFLKQGKDVLTSAFLPGFPVL